jgi:hypothetical protein
LLVSVGMQKAVRRIFGIDHGEHGSGLGSLAGQCQLPLPVADRLALPGNRDDDGRGLAEVWRRQIRTGARSMYIDPSLPLTVIKKLLKNNARFVSFFRGSHYWSGQLDILAKNLGITRKMKTHGDTRWFTQTLQALAVQEMRYIHSFYDVAGEY